MQILILSILRFILFVSSWFLCFIMTIWFIVTVPSLISLTLNSLCLSLTWFVFIDIVCDFVDFVYVEALFYWPWLCRLHLRWSSEVFFCSFIMTMIISSNCDCHVTSSHVSRSYHCVREGNVIFLLGEARMSALLHCKKSFHHGIMNYGDYGYLEPLCSVPQCDPWSQDHFA
jgi:hypothetical protein